MDIFCNLCFQYYQQNINHQCPNCKKYIILYHHYNTRLNYYKKNRDEIITDLKDLMNEFYELEYIDERIIKFKDIFHFIYQNKTLLKDRNFKKIIIEKIQYLKKKNVDIGFYWDQKIYN